MTEQTPKGQDITQTIKVWLSRNNWVYWVLAIGGIIGLIIVAYYLLRKKPQGEVKP